MIIKPNEELNDAICRYQAGDGAAFDAIYYGSLQYITKCVLNVLNRTAPGASEDLKQDIIQDTYLTIADKLHTLQAPEAFFQWAGQIATHHAQRTWNKELHRQQLEVADEDMEFELMDEEFIPEDILENRETRQQIRKLLEELPTNQYLCIVEYFYNGLKETEVAAKLDMPLNTVKTNLSRAKKKLKALFEGESKRGVKLYSMGGILLLLLLQDVQLPVQVPGQAETTLEAIHGKMGSASASASAGTAASAGSGAAAGILSSLGTKIAVGIVAAAVLIGAAIGGNALLKKLVQPAEPTPTVEDMPENYDSLYDDFINTPRHELMFLVRSEMGEGFDGQIRYTVTDTVNGETVASGIYEDVFSILLEPGQYLITLEADRHRTFIKQLDAEGNGYTQMYADLTTDGSWLTSGMLWSIGHWLQYLDLPIGTQEAPSVFLNDGSPENTQVILGTMQNLLDDERSNIILCYEEGDEWYAAEGSVLARMYGQQLFGYLPEELAKQQLQPSESEIKYDYVPTVSFYEQLDPDRIRVWMDASRSPYTVEGDTHYMLGESETPTIVATLRYSGENDFGWVLESAICFETKEGLPYADMGQRQEAREPDETAYDQLLQAAVNAWEWEEKGPVILTKEQRRRMESVLLCTAYADSGIISRMTVASYGALLSDVYVDPEPFLKVTKPAQNNWDKCEVLLLLAWNAEGIQNIQTDSSNSRNYGGSISFDLASAEALMRGLFGEFDASELTENIIIKGYMTEISGGRLYQPKTRVYDCRYGDGYGTLTIDNLERTGSGTIRIYATYRASMTLSCVYEAVENPDSYIGYTLTGVSYSYKE